MKAEIKGEYPLYIAEMEEDTGEPDDGTIVRHYLIPEEDSEYVRDNDLVGKIISGEVHSDHRRIHVFVIEKA